MASVFYPALTHLPTIYSGKFRTVMHRIVSVFTVSDTPTQIFFSRDRLMSRRFPKLSLVSHPLDSAEKEDS
jgi:hypothetical protein